MKVCIGRLFVGLVVIVSIALGCSSIWAQDASKPAPIIPDPDIMKRTPIVDGNIAAGEWDLFQAFTIDDWQVNTYANWDSKNIYMAASSTKPCDLMVLLDANDDGWFHGEDNYEFRAVRQADGSFTKQVLRYESRNTTSIAPTPVTENELSQVEMKVSTANGVTHFEWRIPAFLIRDLKASADKKIGLQIAARVGADENSWVPENVRAETKTCIKSVLVNRKSTALSPLVMDFYVKDMRVTKGDSVNAVLQLNNPGPETVDVRNITMSGNGMSEAYLDVIQKRPEGLAPKKQIKEEMKCVVPQSMPLGTWVVGVEIRSNGQKIGAGLASFDILEPFEAELKLPKADVATNASEVTMSVVIKNNTRRALWGKAKIEMPIGWVLRKNIYSREYAIRTRGGENTITFKATPPLGAVGDVPVKMTVTGGDLTKVVEGTFKLATPK